MAAEIHPDAIQNLINGDHGDPFALLGPHPVERRRVDPRVPPDGENAGRAVRGIRQADRNEPFTRRGFF